MHGVHVLPEERLVSDVIFNAILKHPVVFKYVNDFAANFKKSIGRAMKLVRTTVLPLLPQDVVQRLKEHFSDQSYSMSYIDADVLVEQVPNLRKIQINHERDPE